MEDTNLTPPADAAAPDAQVTANTDVAAAPPETLLERVEEAVEAVVAEVESVVHTIERRTFGRASADEPMPVTTITGN